MQCCGTLGQGGVLWQHFRQRAGGKTAASSLERSFAESHKMDREVKMSKPLDLNRLDLIFIPVGIVSLLILVAHHYQIVPDDIYRPATYIFTFVALAYAIAMIRRGLKR